MSELKGVEYLVSSDAGGTMTDVIVIDPDGSFAIGKAPTTPHNLSEGFIEAFADAVSYLGRDWEAESKDILFSSRNIVYAGTSMINMLINMDGGEHCGLIVTKGFEHILFQGRGRQSVLDYDWPEVFHLQYRKHREPLIPLRKTRGVTERIDMFGKDVIPLYEHEVRAVVEELLAQNVKYIGILFLMSHVNPAHELKAADIAREIIKEKGADVSVLVSHDIAPVTRETSRANSLALQMYAAEPARDQLIQLENMLQAGGYKNSLKTVLCYGGLCDVQYQRLFETALSGPVGGLMGAFHLGALLDEPNIVVGDMGGTSFDTARITDNNLPIQREAAFQRMYINVPMLDIISVGAGTGTYIRLEPATNRIQLGPDSAGGDPGPVFQEQGNETVTICDCDLILGILNPDNYLGGKVKVNKEKAYNSFKEQIADPLGMDVYDAAEQCVQIVNGRMQDHLLATTMCGQDLRDYVFLQYGGAGPMHAFSVAGDLPWKACLTVPFAAGFSAFGCALMEQSQRRHKSVNAMIRRDNSVDEKINVAYKINEAWEDLELKIVEDLIKEGFNKDDIELQYTCYFTYYGMVDDMSVVSEVSNIAAAEEIDILLDKFETNFSKMYTAIGSPSDPTFVLTEVAVVGQVPSVKPQLPKYELQAKEPSKAAIKGTRKIYHRKMWHDATIYELQEIKPGNEVHGPAVLEAPNTTMFIPIDKKIRSDEHNFFWMENSN